MIFSNLKYKFFVVIIDKYWKIIDIINYKGINYVILFFCVVLKKNILLYIF